MKNILFSLFTLIFITSCATEGSSDMASGPSSEGKGGSLARFSLVGDHLYAVNGDKLKVFEIGQSGNPTLQTEITLNVTGTIETLFGRDKNTLFAGTTSGMYIFDISNPNTVKQLSKVEHIVSCDPVVANANYAFVTLRSTLDNNFCNRNINRLQIYNISDLRNPKLYAEKDMVFPIGLGLYGDTLLVCDNGITILDVANPNTIGTIAHYPDIAGIDLIPNKNIMLIGTATGLEQYRYHNGELHFLSRI